MMELGFTQDTTIKKMPVHSDLSEKKETPKAHIKMNAMSCKRCGMVKVISLVSLTTELGLELSTMKMMR